MGWYRLNKTAACIQSSC